MNMQVEIKGGPAFSYLNVVLNPGESIVAESDAMSSMDASLDMNTRFNGGVLKGLARKFLGGESLFINEFKNSSGQEKQIQLVQPVPGEIKEVELNGSNLFVQPGAYVASTPGITLGLSWAGFRSFLAKEGLFRLKLGGRGKVWIGAYGALVEKTVSGEYLVDTSHLVAYEPQLKWKLQLAGGIFSSFFSGEGLVSRLEGKGKILIQTRSMHGLSGWANRYY
jgi:uncharacterized protein (TIGR00266 family)